MTTRNNIKSHAGFTLIEILIAVAILGIVVAIALPNYAAFITKANRTDAMTILSEIAGEQQKYFSENNVYASSLSDLGYDTMISPEGYYTISVSTPGVSAPSSGLSYVLSATPVSDGRQAKDSECNVFIIDSTGAKSNSGGSNNKCW